MLVSGGLFLHPKKSIFDKKKLKKNRMRCCHRPDVRIEQGPYVRPPMLLTGRPLCNFNFDCCSTHPDKLMFSFIL